MSFRKDGARLAHVVASDAHAPHVRTIGFRAAAVGDEALRRRLTSNVPAALLAGRELPPRPKGRP
jgi:hypothetical protein